MRYGLEEGIKVILDGFKNWDAFQDARIGFFTYNDVEDKLEWIYALTDGVDEEEGIQRLSEIRWTYKYGESHALAIQTGWEHLKKNKRPEVPRSLIVVTDGETLSEHEKNTLEVANRAICEGLNIYVLGIETEEHNEKGLKNIAGGNATRTFSADKTSQVSSLICKFFLYIKNKT